MKIPKNKTHFICQECGTSSPKWQGQCRQCLQWNCLVEEVIHTPTKQVSLTKGQNEQQPVQLNQYVHKTTEPRIPSGISELDRVLGGGLVAGSYILLGGAPGIGKSTLLLQMAASLSHRQKTTQVMGTHPQGKSSKNKSLQNQQASKKQSSLTVFYVSAEESVHQTSLRAKRLFKEDQHSIFILHETSLERIIHHGNTIQPDVLIIDSIQTVQLPEIPSAAGTVSQVKECANQLMIFAKHTQTTVIVVGHMTKDGQLAGPRLLEHTVDTVLSFDGDPHYHFRILRATKNRFGPTNEIGVFRMSSQGLVGVANPSEFFLENRKNDVIGSVVFTAMEGSRPLLCEIQALVLPSYLSSPRRTTIGMDVNRLNMVLAVLERYLDIKFSQHDVFLNIAGGLKITEPVADLAVAQALLSAKVKQAINQNSCFFGEIGLSGEIRAATFCENRIAEAQKLGFQHVYLPMGNKKHLSNIDTKINQLQLHWVSSIKDLLFTKG